MSNPCKYVKTDGQSCQAAAIGDTSYCYWHNPQMAQKRAEARKRGGKNRRTGKRTSPHHYSIQGVQDILQALENALNDADALENSHSRARTIGYLCQIALKTLEVGEMENRLKALEEETRRSGGKMS